MCHFTTATLLLSADRASADDKKVRYLIEGVSTPAVYAALMKSPKDRSINAKVLMAEDAKAAAKLTGSYVVPE